MITKKLSICCLMGKLRISCGKGNNSSRTATVITSIRTIRMNKSNPKPPNNNNFLTKEGNKWIKTSHRSIATTKTRGPTIIRTSQIATQRAKTNLYPSTSDSGTLICHRASKTLVTPAILHVWCRPCFISRTFRKRSLHSTKKTNSKISRTWKWQKRTGR